MHGNSSPLAGSVVAGRLVAGSVFTGRLVAGSVFTESVFSGSVFTGRLVAGSVFTGRLVTESQVTGSGEPASLWTSFSPKAEACWAETPLFKQASCNPERSLSMLGSPLILS